MDLEIQKQIEDSKKYNLRPCPFCGSPAIMREEWANTVYCSDIVNCCAEINQGPMGDVDALREWTINAWNNRK